jgi:hypothetical protein
VGVLKPCCIIIGARIDHFANVRPTIRECLIFGLGRPAARSSQSLYLAIASHLQAHRMTDHIFAPFKLVIFVGWG